jgi:hypothetical protein
MAAAAAAAGRLTCSSVSFHYTYVRSVVNFFVSERERGRTRIGHLFSGSPLHVAVTAKGDGLGKVWGRGLLSLGRRMSNECLCSARHPFLYLVDAGIASNDDAVFGASLLCARQAGSAATIGGSPRVSRARKVEPTRERALAARRRDGWLKATLSGMASRRGVGTRCGRLMVWRGL